MKFQSLSPVLLAAVTFSFFSCAQEPQPIVPAKTTAGNVAGLQPGTAEKKTAVFFNGRDLFGKPCEMALSIEKHGAEDHILTKVNYVLHGETLPDMEAEAYRYDIASNQYSQVTATSGTIAIAAAALNNDAEADINQLDTYEQQGTLSHSLRIDFKGDDWVSFEEGLKKVAADANEFAAYSSSLDQIDRLIFKIGHNGHYDSSACFGLTPTKAEDVTFVLDGDHDHDGDHDDDHDHDHDHD